MGIASYKSLDSYVSMKYRLAMEATNIKSQSNVRLALWRIGKSPNEPYEMHACLKWPYKLYSDEAYVVLLLTDTSQNELSNDTPEEESQLPTNLSDLYSVLCKVNVSRETAEALYLFQIQSLQSYQTLEWTQKHYLIQISTIVGDSLEPYDRAEATRWAHQLTSYLKTGGYNAVKRAYHENDSLVYPEAKASHLGFKVKLTDLLLPKTYSQNGTANQAQVKQQLISMAAKLAKIKTIRQLILGSTYCRLASLQAFKSHLQGPQRKIADAALTVGGHVLSEKGLNHLFKVNPHLRELYAPPQPKKQSKKDNFVDLDESSPFLCEITEININRDHRELNQLKTQSLLVEQINELISNAQFYSMEMPPGGSQFKPESQGGFSNRGPKPAIILTQYLGSREFNRLESLNVKTIVNCSSEDCYNYFPEDFDYLSFYVQSHVISHENPSIFNIECLVFQLAFAVDASIKRGKSVLLFCNSELFQVSGSLLIGLLIVSYHLAYPIALEYVKTATNGTFLKPCEIYQEQLIVLSNRILSDGPVSAATSGPSGTNLPNTTASTSIMNPSTLLSSTMNPGLSKSLASHQGLQSLANPTGSIAPPSTSVQSFRVYCLMSYTISAPAAIVAKYVRISIIY